MLTIGDLNIEPPAAGAPRWSGKPLEEGLTVLLQVLNDANQIDVVKIARSKGSSDMPLPAKGSPLLRQASPMLRFAT